MCGLRLENILCILKYQETQHDKRKISNRIEIVDKGMAQTQIILHALVFTLGKIRSAGRIFTELAFYQDHSVKGRQR